jgi:hypothetical protein
MQAPKRFSAGFWEDGMEETDVQAIVRQAIQEFLQEQQ